MQITVEVEVARLSQASLQRRITAALGGEIGATNGADSQPVLSIAMDPSMPPIAFNYTLGSITVDRNRVAKIVFNNAETISDLAPLTDALRDADVDHCVGVYADDAVIPRKRVFRIGQHDVQLS